MGILIVEDESITAMYIESALKTKGYSVSGVFPTGEEAIALAEKEKPDLILMDVGLAGNIDGIETARRVLSIHKTPVIFMTAYSDDATRERAMSLDPVAFLVKPFGLAKLTEAVAQAITPK